MANGFIGDFRRFFVRGLAVVLPPLLTIVILVWIFRWVNNYIAQYTNIAAQWVVVQYLAIMEKVPFSLAGKNELWDATKALWEQYHLWWIGFILAFAGIYVLGKFMASFLGRGTWRIIERTFFSLPGIKAIYPYVKQVTDFLLSEQRVEFSRVVAVEYPRKGLWSIGLVTGPGMRKLRSAANSDLLTIFIPSSPTPVTGYTITVKKDEVIDLPITIEEALKFTVSGGVIMPINQMLSEAEIDKARQGVFPASQRKETQE